MDSHREAELQYWRNTFLSYPSPADYVAARCRDFNGYASVLPEIREESGDGLDLACGLVSIFENPVRASAGVWAVDALMDEYDAVYRAPGNGVRYRREDGERLSFADASFDFACCLNAIDHTPDPGAMATEVHRVLRPGGRLYFAVNFDRPPLAPAHYALWTQGHVDACLRDFHLERAVVVWTEQWQKYVYHGRYVRR